MTVTLEREHRIPAYAWVVFALTFGLLISDYMARQVLNAVFPLLKAEWALSDTQLGLLSGVVAIMVGLLTFPLSLLADRLGRVRSLTAMAIVWSLATLLCGVARNYEQMLAGRLLVGVGEAAYGSVGIAVVISVFPKRLRATLSAAFMAGGLFGQVLGVGIGGLIAEAHGWRTAFFAIGLSGLLLGIVYPILVGERRLAFTAEAAGNAAFGAKPGFPKIRTVFAGRTLKCAYVGQRAAIVRRGLPAGLAAELFQLATMISPWRAPPSLTALFLAICGAGMVTCGLISDRLFNRPRTTAHAGGRLLPRLRRFPVRGAGAWAGPDPADRCSACAMFLAAASTGPAGAMVADLTPGGDPRHRIRDAHARQ